MCFESVTISFELRMTQNRVGERPSYIQPFGSLFLSQKHFLVFLRKNDRERSPWEENRLSSRRSRIFLAPHKKIARMTSHCDRVTFCARKSKSCRESTVLRACHAQVRGGRFHDGNEITGMMDSAGSKRLFNPRNAVRVWNWWLEPQCLADREQKKVRGKEPWLPCLQTFVSRLARVLGLTGSVCVVIAVPRLADLHTTCDSGSLLTLNKWNIFGFFSGFPPLANLTEGWLCIFAANKCSVV